MLRTFFAVAGVATLFVAACAGPQADAPPDPAISTSAADNLIPGQVARSAALQVEIRSAGHDCSKVVRSFNQGTHDDAAVWNAECEGGGMFGVVSNGDGTTDVFDCDALEGRTGTACFEKFSD